MRKLTRQSLDELAQVMPVIDEREMRSFVGGGDGTYNNPYTEAEYEEMMNSGNWYGGFVDYGSGCIDYVLATSFCSGNAQTVSGFNGHYINYHLLREGWGISATNVFNGYTIVESGIFTVIVSDAHTDIQDYLGSTGFLSLPNAYIYSTGDNPLGSFSFNLSQYTGNIEVVLEVTHNCYNPSMGGNHVDGFTNKQFIQVIGNDPDKIKGYNSLFFLVIDSCLHTATYAKSV